MNKVKSFSEKSLLIKLENAVNDWLSQNKVAVKTVSYSRNSPGDTQNQHNVLNQHNALVSLIYEEATVLCQQSIHIISIDSGDALHIDEKIASWQQRRQLNIMSVGLHPTIAIGEDTCGIPTPPTAVAVVLLCEPITKGV